MEKYIRRIIMSVCVLFFAGAVFRYAQIHIFYEGQELPETVLHREERGGRTRNTSPREHTGIQDEAETRDSMQSAENEDKNDDPKTSEESFYEKAEKRGIGHEEAKEYWERFLKEDIFRNGAMELTGWFIEDMDGNGEKDLLVMVLDKEKVMNYGSYGGGCLWIYMNEEEPYSYEKEDCPYFGCFYYFAEDIDNDGNVEIAFSSQGTGCGAAGDSYKAIFKYRNHAIEEMDLPSDLGWDYDRGIRVSVYQEAEENRYSAHCPYFGETVYFRAENAFGPEKAAREAGSNVRGFFNLCPVKYKGKNALQASEYLNGEGGTMHCVGVAYFIILWDENGKAYVDQWWVEGDINQYANHKGSCIAYADGYYYYASQSDHYYLYRAKEDGSDAVCLAKAHSGTVYADGEAVYFVNLSDDRAIYRVNPDGSGMEKLCDASGDQMQVSGEYIYFCAPYEKEYDIHGLFSEAEVNSHQGGYLYRMKKDGSGKEILMADAGGFTLAAADGSDVMYDGNIYCGYHRKGEAGQETTIVMQYDLDGKNGKEIAGFDFYGDILIGGDRIYCYTVYGGDAGRISMYTLWDNKRVSLPNMNLTDYCIYKGTLYGLRETADEERHLTEIYALEYDKPDRRTMEWKKVLDSGMDSSNSSNSYLSSGKLADIYATEQGIFLRKFVSSEEGVRWFFVGEGEGLKRWEDEEGIPAVRPASLMEYTGEWNSITIGFESTEGYEEYLEEDLSWQEYYEVDEEGEGRSPYTIRLPQFNEKIEGYREINGYFQKAYQEALEHKKDFFDMLDEEKEKGWSYTDWFEGTYYHYVYIGEEYITVEMYQCGWSGGIRGWNLEEPVTFERKTGKAVPLETFFKGTQEEAVAEVTASVYKYMECEGWRNGVGLSFFWKDKDILTEQFHPEQFFLFPEGIGIYYERYAIDSGAAGDCLFIVPF